jgi:hypothetical protein
VILFVYDDSIDIPESIRRTIGASHFGDIVRRKRRLSDTIQATVEAVLECEFLRVTDSAQLLELIDKIARLPADAMIFRLPSSIVPASSEVFSSLMAKLPYALDPVLYGAESMTDAPSYLFRDDAIALLGARETGKRRKFLGAVETRAVRVGNDKQFVDISEISWFLAFMAGATEARHFNSTSISAGIFRKHSRDVAKMRGEYQFFHIADEAMKRFLLPTFDFSQDSDGAGYAMEYLLVPDAAMQVVHHTFNEASFGRMMDGFFAFIGARGRSNVGATEVRNVAERDIVDKLNRRVAQLLATPVGQQLDQIITAAGPHGSLGSMVERCRVQLHKALGASQFDDLALSHGDPCFSNILYQSEINLFRLIDPRGALDRDAAMMHPVYDLAKFSHSVLGGYDFVNGGLAECRLDAAMRLSLHFDRGGPPPWMKEALRRRFAELGWDIALIRAIEASLFLSMLPLHIDAPDKLPAFCLIAGEILDELEAMT